MASRALDRSGGVRVYPGRRAGAPGGAEAGWADLHVLVRAAGRFTAPIPLGEALLANWLLGQAGLEGQGGVLSFAADAQLGLRDGKVDGTVHDVPWGRHAEAVVAIADDAGTPSVVLLARAEAAEQSHGLNVAGEPRDGLRFSAAAVLASAPLPPGVSADVLLLGGRYCDPRRSPALRRHCWI